MCKYYHDSQAKMLVAMPAEPSVFEKKDRQGRTIEWVVMSEQHITRADNARIPRTQRWKYPIKVLLHEVYDSHRDSRSKAIDFFKRHLPNLPEIDEQIYLKLKMEYNEIARANKFDD